MRLVATLLLTAIFLACDITRPMCACPPATTTFRVYGTVIDANGSPIAGATLAARASADARCDSYPEQFEPILSRVDEPGAFSALLRSGSQPALRCLRLASYRTLPGTSDSAVVAGLLVTFKMDHERPDSLGLVITIR